MRVLADLDPHRLEAALLETVARLADAGPARRVVVLVPTARLVRHVERRLGQRRDGWLGVTTLHLQAAARRSAAHTGPPPTVLSSRLLERLLASVLQRRRGGRWSEAVLRRPGTLGRIHASLRDLREAAIEPAALAAIVADEDERELAEIYEAYSGELARLEAQGLADDAGLVRLAVAGVPGWLGPDAAAVVYGAYELNGIQLDLVNAIDAVAETVALVPCVPGATVSIFAERWATSRLNATLEPPPRPSAVGCGLPLEQLFDEPARPPAAAAGRIAVRHAQGEAAELRAALRDALAAVGEGCPPEEIAIVARSLAPYAAALDAAVEELDLPVATSARSPLRREPLVRDALGLLRVAGDDFPRHETVTLLASPRIRWRALAEIDAAPRGDLADAWSRAGHLIGGRRGWTAGLAAWIERDERRRAEHGHVDGEAAERRRRHADAIGRCVVALAEALPPEAATWTEHAARFARLFETAFGTADDDDARDPLALIDAILDDMRLLERLPDAGRRVPFEVARRWFESAVDAAARPRADDDRGIRILDAMQARGMTFRRVTLVGFNAGRFPQQGAEDPILPDELRRRLAETGGRPLPLAASRVDEERLLLALSFGSAAERLDVSWQRADESGRSRTPSLALRELARLMHGEPDVAPLADERAHHPSHPEQVLDRFLAQPGLLAPHEARLLDALRLRDVGRLDELAARHPELGDGLRMLEATQSFAPTASSAAYDGRVGAGATRIPSVSAIERLGLCPLQYFFDRVLGIAEPDDEPDQLTLSPREVGSAIHDALEAIYGEIADGGGFGGELAALERRALAALDRRRESLLGDAGEPIRALAPRLWAHLTRRWHAALTQVVRADVRRLHAGGFAAVGLEEQVETTIELGGGVTLDVRGRLDRRMRSGDTEVISDYKTSRSLRDKVDVTTSLKGTRLQVALYSLMVEGRPDVELIGVRPGMPDEDRFCAFAGFNGEQLESFRDTLRVLVELERGGRFPLVPGRHCSHCAYSGACRRTHPPTRQREAHAPDTTAFVRLAAKTATSPWPDGSR